MIWTATKIDDGTFCIKNFWYQYMREPRYVPSPNGAMARGIFLHKFKEGFYKTDKQGNIVPKYKSAEAFANTAKVRWNFIVSRGTIQSREIKWKDKREPWILRAEIMNMCKKVYERYSEEEQPLFTEVPFEFYFDDRHYRGKIDEIRKNMVIRDLKTGHRKPEEGKLLVDPQFTLYALAFMSMCYANRRFAETCGVSKEEVERWNGNPNILSEKVKLEYCLLGGEEIKIYDAVRNNNHYYDFCNMLDGLEKQIGEEQWRYVKRGRNCAYCKCYDICVEDAKLKKPAISPSKGKQLELFKDAPKQKQEKEHKQLRFRFPKEKVNR